MRNEEYYLELFSQYDQAFWIATIDQLKNDFNTYKNDKDYQGETFAEMLDTTFWAMGCDYYDYATILFDNYFSLVFDENELEGLKNEFMDISDNYNYLAWFIFDKLALPRIHAIITGETK